MVLWVWESRQGGEAVPMGRGKGCTLQLGPAPFSKELVFTLSKAADAGAEGLRIHPQGWSGCQLLFALGLSCPGPLFVALVMWSHVQTLLASCEFLNTRAVGSFRIPRGFEDIADTT